MASDTSSRFDSFKYPQKYNRTTIGRLSYRVRKFFCFQLAPEIPPVSIESMTAGEFSDWVWGTIVDLRARNALPFEIHHLRAVSKVLHSIDTRVPLDPVIPESLDKAFPSSQLRQRWQELGRRLQITLPPPSTSGLGCIISLVLAAFPYVAFLMWFSQAVGPIGPGWQRRLGWVFFIAAIFLALFISRLLRPLFPGLPDSGDTASKVAERYAASYKLRPGDPVWTEELVWEKTRALIADAAKTEISRITPESRLAEL